MLEAQTCPTPAHFSTERPLIGARGLLWFKRSDYWYAFWQARRDKINLGFRPRSQKMWSGPMPTEKDGALIIERCTELHERMLAWPPGSVQPSKTRKRYTSLSGSGKAFTWIREHVSHTGDECLTWPFSISTQTGRTGLGVNGKHYSAHRLMCELAHGPQPSPKHVAAFLCESGSKGCVNPKHLVVGSWTETRRSKPGQERWETDAPFARVHCGNAAA